MAHSRNDSKLMRHQDYGNSKSTKRLNTDLFSPQVLSKDLERADIKKWLQQILDILMAERSKEERTDQKARSKFNQQFTRVVGSLRKIS
jgi:hypothetical protein